MSDELPKGWATAQISEVTERVPNIKPEDSPEKEFGYVDISSIDNSGFVITDVKRFKGKDAPSRARRPIRPNDIVFSNVRTYLRNIALVDSNCTAEICSTGFTVLRPNAAVEPRFLFRYVLTDQFLDRVTPQQTGTHYPATSDRVVMSETIPLAPLTEQRRIVAKLEVLLGKVDACQQRLAKIPVLLKRFRQSVLAAACSGRLTADWREENPGIESASEFLARVRSARGPKEAQTPDEVESIPTEELPDGWVWTPLWEVLKAQNGRSFPSKEYADSGVRLLRPGNLHVSGNLEWHEDNTALLPSRWADDYPDFVLERGDLLMNLTAQSLKDEFLGRVCLKSDELPALLNQRICRFKLWTEDDLRPFIFRYFKSPRFRSYVNTLDTGSLIRHMHTKQVLGHVAPLPPLAEQQKIVRRVEGLFALADQIEARFQKARSQVERLTPSLLTRAFAGQLVPQDPTDEPAEKFLERIHAHRHS